MARNSRGCIIVAELFSKEYIIESIFVAARVCQFHVLLSSVDMMLGFGSTNVLGRDGV